MMKYSLKPYAIMEYGRRKDKEGNPHQEDAMWPTLDALNYAARVFVLCDGMGGHEAGEVASQTVCEALGRSLQFNDEGLLTDATLQQGMENAYQALDARDRGGEKKMGTTMTLLALDAGGAVLAHLGDSRVYHFRPGATREETIIMHRTEDHSVVNEMVRLGEMTEEEARVAPNKNVITRAMQPNMQRRCRADVYHQTDILPGDYFMLCSDGILEQLTDANLRFIFSDQGGDAANKVKILLEQTSDNNDNHTAFIIHITGVEGEPSPRPADNGGPFSLLAFPGVTSTTASVPTPSQPAPPVTIKTVSSAGVMPQQKPAGPQAQEQIRWEERKPEQQSGGMHYMRNMKKKSSIGPWILAIACVIAAIAIIWIFVPNGDESVRSSSAGPEEATVDVGYEEVNRFNRRQEDEQSAIDAAARQAQSSRGADNGPDEAVAEDPNQMWSSTDADNTPSPEKVEATKKVNEVIQSVKPQPQAEPAPAAPQQ